MTSSSDTTFDASGARSGGHCCLRSGKANWSGTNIAAMVLGFVFFWPIGLFFLYWILKGRSVGEIPSATGDMWSKATGSWSGKSRQGKYGASDNEVFNEYQQTQYDRIREIKDEMKERTRRFAEFRDNARRRADEEEFRRFMADTPADNGTSPG